MAAIDRKWAERIRGGDSRALAHQFEHEANELRRLVREHRADLPREWQDFRCFLAGAGPSPGPAFRLQKTDPRGGFGPGNVQWTINAKAVVAEAPRVPPSTPGSSRGHWTMVAGLGVDYADLPERFGVSFPALVAAVEAGVPLDDVLDNLRRAKDEVANLAWFSENNQHQAAFKHAFFNWRLRVQPRHLSAATPRFLYLYMLLPTMAACRATLVEAGLWAPSDPAAVFRRDEHAAWKRFNELLPKATAIIAGFDAYRQYSLIQDIEALSERVTAAELRMREIAQPAARSAA